MDYRQEMESLLSDSHKTMADIAIYMNKFLPSSLFRYRAFDQYLCNNLSGKIHMSKVSTLNDPFDSRISFDLEKFINSENGKKMLQYKYPYLFNSPNYYELNRNIEKQVIDGIQEEIRISCFSERLDSILMWSHYSNNHSGYCLEYGTKEINNGIKKRLYPVIYDINRKDITNDVIENSQNAGLKSIIYKSEDWAYEKEWRVFKLIPENRKEEFFNLRSALKAVYLGARCSVDNKEKVIKWCRTNSVKVYQMTLSDKKYKLEISTKL